MAEAKTTDTPKETTTKKAAAKAEESVQAAAARMSYVYLGPSLKTVPLRQGATYVGGIPKQFQNIYDTNADVRFLFVSMDDYLEFRRALQDPGSEQSYVFNQIKASGV